MLRLGLLVVLALGLGACSKPKSSSSDDSSGGGSSSRYLYVASGACHSGGSLAVYTTTTASNQVFRVNTQTGAKDFTLADYTTAPSQIGDSPVGLADGGTLGIYVLIENSTATLRRIERVEKRLNGSRSVVLFGNGTIMANQVRDLALNSSGDFLVTRNTAVEKFSGASLARVTQGTASFIQPPITGGGCAVTSAGTLSRALQMPNGMIAMATVTSGTLAKVAIVASTGYVSGASCLSSAQTPLHTWSLATGLAYDSTNNILLVGYGGYSANGTHKVNTIYAYTVDTTTGALGATPTRIYDAADASFTRFMYGISAIALDATEGALYVASSRDGSATSTGHEIHKFTYTPANVSGTLATNVLTPSTTSTFTPYSLDTKCISAMTVGE